MPAARRCLGVAGVPDYSACNAGVSGGTCRVSYTCAVGYSETNPNGTLALECDNVTHRYNATAAGECSPNPCTQAMGCPRDASLAACDCAEYRTGDTCEPSCAPGYGQTFQRKLGLVLAL